jgi:hypothetical protein
MINRKSLGGNIPPRGKSGSISEKYETQYNIVQMFKNSFFIHQLGIPFDIAS